MNTKTLKLEKFNDKGLGRGNKTNHSFTPPSPPYLPKKCCGSVGSRHKKDCLFILLPKVEKLLRELIEKYN